MDSLKFRDCSAQVRPRVLVSRCLLHQDCRYDGGDNRCPALMNLCTRGFFEVVSVCPEVELGMPTPRMPIDLVVTSAGTRLYSRNRREDWTDRMRTLCSRRVRDLGAIDAAILKAKSPSCGNGTTKRYAMDGLRLDQSGDGFLVDCLKRHGDVILWDEFTLQSADLDFEAISIACEKRTQQSCSEWRRQIEAAWKSMTLLLLFAFLLFIDGGWL